MLETCLLVCLGLLVGAMDAYVFRHMPAGWLLDYGETDLEAAEKAQAGFQYFPHGLLLMLSDGFIFGCAHLTMGITLRLFIVLYIAQPLLLMMAADFRTRIIPDQFIIALLPGGVLLWLIDGFSGEVPFLRGLLLRVGAGLLAGLLLYGCGFIAGRLMKREAMGMGDVKLLSACAFVTGLSDLPFLFFLSFVTAALVAIPILISRLWRTTEPEIAFGPYIAISTLLLLLFSDQIRNLWQAYLALVS